MQEKDKEWVEEHDLHQGSSLVLQRVSLVLHPKIEILVPNT